MLTSPPLLAVVGSLLGHDLTAGLLDRVCGQVANLLPVQGIAITLTPVTTGVGPATGVWGGVGMRVVVGASDRTAWWLEMAQLTAGVGPCTQATSSGQAVAVDDFPAAVLQRWPGLGEQLSEASIGAVAAVPLRAGSMTIGSLDAYRADRHRWLPAELTDITEAARVLALGLSAARVGDHPVDRDPGGDPDGVHLLPPGQTAVAQATGMVMAALELSPADAVSRLRATAFLQGRLLTEIADDVRAHRLPATLP